MSDDELFPNTKSLSPRLQWLKRHSLICIAEDPALVGVECAETGDEASAYYCLRSDAEGCMQEQPLEKIGKGDDPDECCIDFAKRNGLKTWHTEARP